MTTADLHPRRVLARVFRVLRAHGRAHLAPTVQWSREAPADPAQAVVAGLAFAGPVGLAVAIGHPAWGLAAAAGALTLSGLEPSAGFAAQARSLGVAALTAAVAAIAAVLLAGQPPAFRGLALALFAGVAALLGGFSRPTAVAAVRLVVFTTILSAVAAQVHDRAGLLLMLSVGGAWAMLLALAAALLPRPRPAIEPVRTPTLAQYWTRYRATLATPRGWQFAGRLTGGLAAAGVLDALLPAHHLHWAGLTVAILSVRDLSAPATKLLQRTLGAVLGVLLGALLLLWPLPAWGLVAGLAVIAGLRPLLKAGNYLAYTAVMTPLVLMITELGRAPPPGLLADRLGATLVGALLVAAASWLARLAIRATSPQPVPASAEGAGPMETRS
jgi:hypothetical protein